MQSIRNTTDHLNTGEQFLWLQRVGYVRVRDLIRYGTLLYVFLTGVVTVVTSDLVTLGFLGIVAVVVLMFVSVDRHVSSHRRVTIYTEGGLYIAEHAGTEAIRHGYTPEDALASLETVIASDHGETELS